MKNRSKVISRKFFAVLIVSAVVLSAMPQNVFAEEVCSENEESEGVFDTGCEEELTIKENIEAGDEDINEIDNATHEGEDSTKQIDEVQEASIESEVSDDDATSSDSEINDFSEDGMMASVSNIGNFTVAYDVTKGVYIASVSDISYDGTITGVSFPTWSSTGDQDDIVWYSGIGNGDGSYSALISPSNHKHLGTYYCHCYINGSSGMKFVSGQQFSVSSPKMEGVSVSEYNTESGTAVITIDFGNTNAGVRSVLVPVWSADDQSNICWYSAAINSEGKYVVNFNIGNHKGLAGDYKIHVYCTDINGTFKYVGAATTITVNENNGNLNVTASAGGYQVTLSGVSLSYAFDSIIIPVWSASNGQDDLVWYQATRTSSGEYTVSVDIAKHRTLGQYYVHVYTSSAGNLKFLTGTTFDIAEPSGGTVSIVEDSYDPSKGTYKVQLAGVENYSAVSSVLFPTWSKSDQSDIKWYSSVNNGDGTYYATVDLVNHNYCAGTYYTHAYIVDMFGNMKFVSSVSKAVTMDLGTISVADSTDGECTYVVNISGVSIPAGIKSISCPTWSNSGGQDDIVWYGASEISAGNYSATIKISNHKTVGKYNVHVYATTLTGNMVFIGSDTFEVSGVTGNVTANANTYSVTAQDVKSASGISNVQYAIWSKSDQSDIAWYSTDNASDNYLVKILFANHKYNTGTYTIHMYVTTGNGIFTFAGATNAVFTPENYVEVICDNAQKSSYTISLINAKVNSKAPSAVLFPTWCSVNDQDDIIWYSGTATGNNSWTVSVVSYRHMQTGTYYTHIYADGVFVGSASYEVAAGEEAEMHQRIANVASATSYLIAVDCTTNRLGVFSGSAGNWKLVEYFMCTTGKPETPTVKGEFTVGDKGTSFGHGYTCWYWTRIYGDYLFHSCTYQEGSMTEYMDPRLGMNLSNGCVRVDINNAKWIQDNIPTGTKIVIY